MAQVGGVRTRTRSWASWIRLQDPNREKEKRRELEYEFGSGPNKRRFYGNPDKRGPYAPDED